ncbi:hypothetical protein OQA88_8304 [Cercophora sp. LCS_1]
MSTTGVKDDMSSGPPIEMDGTVEMTITQSRKLSIVEDASLPRFVKAELNVTDSDLQQASAIADQMTLEEVKTLIEKVLKLHERDPNFPQTVIDRIKEFLGNDDAFEKPEEHAHLIYEMKLEAALITSNSPYSEVRSVVDNHDDLYMPSSTIRAWVIGLMFSVIIAAINQLFSIRFPPVYIGSNVAQLLSYPLGKLCDRFLPDWGFTLSGVRHSLNPGPFSKKEHMLITIMATVSTGGAYTANIVWVQYLPIWFNQKYAGQFSYQILVALSTNLIGYGVAGLTRRFLVYPSYCVWPASLSTIALNTAFHSKENLEVEGPFGKWYRVARYKFFLYAFGCMFVWFWIPDSLFTALGSFSWITWISPNNIVLSAISGFKNGLGFNPWPTFDWNVLQWDGTDPLMIPFFTTANKFVGSVMSSFVVMAVWFSNSFFTAYLPINTNSPWDNTGHPYDVSRAIDGKGILDKDKYEAYSPVYLGAGNLVVYMFFFAIYPATLVYVALNHRYELMLGFKNLIKGFWKAKESGTAQYLDVHNRLMAKYTEVPEWWYFILLIIAVACGAVGIADFGTNTTPAVILYGLLMCFVFVVPIGIVKAITGVEVFLNVLAEFIGGVISEGNAVAVNYFKTYGVITCVQTLAFANDLKLAHYVKLPPRHTFMAQVVATVLSTFISTALLDFQLNGIPDVCTDKAPNKMTCPGLHTFFTASIMWGTIGPKKIFGGHGQYKALMAGWPLGAALSLAIWLLQRRLPQQKWLRQVHPVLILYGCALWAPYNLSYVIPSVWISWLSWIWCKNRFVGFWSKYNFVLSAAFSTGIAVSFIIIFFALGDVKLDWWGNKVVSLGCEDNACTLKHLKDGETFGPGPGEY